MYSCMYYFLKFKLMVCKIHKKHLFFNDTSVNNESICMKKYIKNLRAN